MVNGLRLLSTVFGLMILLVTAVIVGTRRRGGTPPDAWRVATDHYVSGTYSIFRARVNDNFREYLTDYAGSDQWPAVSPDGRWIAFVSDRDGGRALFKMRADGSDLVRLTEHDIHAQSFAWSPDNEWFALEAIAVKGGHGDLYALRADGSGFIQLTDDRPWDGMPVWSPDGEWIIFRTYREVEGASRLYRIRLDGTGLEPCPDAGAQRAARTGIPVSSRFVPALTAIAGIMLIAGAGVTGRRIKRYPHVARL